MNKKNIEALNNLKQSIGSTVVEQKKSKIEEGGSGKKKLKRKDQAYIRIGDSSDDSNTNMVQDIPIVKREQSSDSDHNLSQPIIERGGVGIVIVEDVDSPKKSVGDQLPFFNS